MEPRSNEDLFKEKLMRKYVCFNYQKEMDYSRIRQWIVELTSMGIISIVS